MRKFLFPLVLAFTGYSASAQQIPSEADYDMALNDTVKNKKGEVLQEIIINSNQQKKPVSVGKSGIAPMDLPQSTAVISHATLESQQAVTLSDVLKNANGLYIMGTTGGYQEEVASRGSALAGSNIFKNGVRYFSGMSTELSGIERVEFLKGSAAILYGNVAAGGILNMVTKKPRTEFGGDLGFRLASFNTIQPTLDIYGSLNKKKTILFRTDASYEKGDSFRKEVESERYYVNPSVLFKFSDKTQLLVEGDYLNDHKTPDFGAGIINYEIVAIPRNRFLGVSWGYFDAQQASATATLSHEINENWEVSFVNALRYYDTELFSNTRPNASGGTVSANGDWTRSVQKSKVKDNYFLQQLDLKGKFAIGKTGHQFLVGADNEIYKTTTSAFKNQVYDTINIFEDYDPSSEAPIPTMIPNTVTTAPVKRFGVYVQDLVTFNKYLKLLAGVRYSNQNTENSVYTFVYPPATSPAQNPVVTNNYDDAFSPRVGVIVQPSENQSLFASYASSFQVNTGTDVNLKPLEPSIIDQFEVGIKNKFFDERLFANITAYQITNSNLAQISLENGNSNTSIKELTGKTRSQGIEIDITANPAEGLSVMAGYSFNETIYVKSNTYIEGSELRYNPKNTANLSANYKFVSKRLKGLSIGAVTSYFGDRYAGRSTTAANPNYRLIKLGDYVQLDATVGYEFGKFAIRGRLANLTNELSYNIHDDNSLNPIAPRSYSISLNYHF